MCGMSSYCHPDTGTTSGKMERLLKKKGLQQRVGFESYSLDFESSTLSIDSICFVTKGLVVFGFSFQEEYIGQIKLFFNLNLF